MTRRRRLVWAALILAALAGGAWSLVSPGTFLPNEGLFLLALAPLLALALVLDSE